MQTPTVTAELGGDLPTFDVTGPLPTGTVLLEASAGTGKTWTIGALVTRYVAEGVATLDEMLIVTFGRAASQELRERVREHLTRTERRLAHPESVQPGEDAVIDLLLAADPHEVEGRRRRLRAALGSFDGATIATTHQFCQLVLDGLGVAGDTDPAARLVEDTHDLLVEVVDDLYIRGFGSSSQAPTFSRAEALSLAESVFFDPQAAIEPQLADASGQDGVERASEAGRRVRFAHAVRHEMAARMRRLGLLGYDDLLSQLADALEADDAPARTRMRQRWRIVLVDEFQDTDPVQWQVFDRAFSGHATMVLIGDPKQAIYAFRGGDVVTYLQAARTADARMTLGTNRRADAALVRALQATWEGARLGDAAIVVRPVEAVHETPRLVGAPHPYPLRVRVLPRQGRSRTALMRVGGVREKVAADLAADIAALLASDATFEGRPIEARDVAVLAHTSRQLQLAQTALRELGVPAVVAGGGSVFRTPAATDWLTVLEAMEQPHRSARVRAAALTPFVGVTAVELDAGGDRLTDRVATRMRWWATLFATRGLAAVLEAATSDGLPGRVLRHVGGERDLTDLRHLGETLHDVGLHRQLGLSAMLVWLREQMADDSVVIPGARMRRLDSDAAAVQLSTIHASKGLQYPVVYAPFLFDRWVSDKAPARLFHRDDEQRAIDVGARHPQRAAHVGAALAEDAGESLRLLYVALTRAQSQVCLWWAPATNTPAAPLHRMLFGRAPGVATVPDTAAVLPDDQSRQALDLWAQLGGPRWELVGDNPSVVGLPTSDTPALAARPFDRDIDAVWRRTSYTALTRVDPAAAPLAQSTSEPEVLDRQDEPALPLRPDTGDVAGDLPSPMAGLPVGATFGSLVHAVLEESDPQAPDLRAELADRIDEQIVRWPVDLDRGELADALFAVLDSPLGPLAPDTRLRDIGLGDRLCELEFEMPLVGGDLRRTDGEPVRLGDLAAILRRHLPADDPVRPYADALDGRPLGEQELRGYLTGSLDLVCRVDGRYLVADYKTNWLGPFDEPLTARAYRPEALVAAMGHSSYPLQALLYAVVLHRYLRWRVPGYDPDTHLGGVLYLYVRGMCGPATPLVDGHPCGVFSWRPPSALVVELSGLLDGVVAGGSDATDVVRDGKESS